MTADSAGPGASVSDRVVLAHEPAVRLGPLTVHPALRQVVHADGRDEIVQPKVMEVMVALLHAHGRILTRDELCDAAWEGRIVGDDSINRILSRLRRLSEGIGAGAFTVETITKVGYRLAYTQRSSATEEHIQATPATDGATTISPFTGAVTSPIPTPVARGIDRRMIGGGLAAVLAAGVGGWRLFGPRGVASDSVAVLPFANLSGDPLQAYFSDGVAEELRSALTRIVRLKVAARTSSEQMRNTDAQTAAAKLGVANIVTGSVRRGAGTIRVAAQLVSGRDGLVRWSDSYDRAAGDALTIEAGIAESVASALNIALGRAEKVLLSAGGTASAAAHDAYLRGSALVVEQKPQPALAAFDIAVAADPNFALARAARAGVMTSIAINLGDTAARLRLAAAEAEARQAVALAPDVGTPLAQLGYVLQYRLDLRGAAAAYAAAYAKAPGDATVLWLFAVFQALMGRSDDAVQMMKRAQMLDPLAAGGVATAGFVLLHTGRIDAAIATMRQELVRSPGNPRALADLGYALIAQGQPDAALKVVANLPPDAWERLTSEAIAKARLGDRAGSDRALAALAQQDDVQYQLAQVHAERGETEAAFNALSQAYDVRDAGLLDLKTDPLLARLHADPRLGMLEHRIGFP